MSYYYGLTIGPIYGTISRVKATRELWAASYMFSYLMEQIATKLESTPGLTLLLPSTKKDLSYDLQGVGLYPDRMILVGEEQHTTTIQTIIDSEVKSFAQQVAKSTSVTADRAETFLKKYLQTYLVQVERDNPADAVQSLNDLMDVSELRQPYLLEANEMERILQRYFFRINGSALMRTAFPKGKPDIDTLIEISTRELGTDYVSKDASDAYKKELKAWEAENIKRFSLETQSEKETDPAKKSELEAEIKSLKNEELNDRISKQDALKPFLKNYHKYIAVVQADGDNVGQAIKKLGTKNSDYQDFSKSLLDFGMGAAKQIRDFGGFPVYVGGDDLLFFAPVMYQGKTIFELFKNLDDFFKDTVPSNDTKKTPSLSFGLSISFHKFPLREALGISHHQLDQVAKIFPLTQKPRTAAEKNQVEKNAIAFQLLKHSGQSFGGVLPVKKALFTAFDSLMKDQLTKEDGLISSIAYQLNKHEILLDNIGTKADRLENFFSENFNEAVHQGPSGADYLQLVQKLVLQAYQDAETMITATGENADLSPKDLTSKRGKYARKTIYGILRTIQFLKQAYED